MNSTSDMNEPRAVRSDSILMLRRMVRSRLMLIVAGVAIGLLARMILGAPDNAINSLREPSKESAIPQGVKASRESE